MSRSGARTVGRLLLRRRGTLVWDGVLRGSAVLALAGIAVLEFGSPAAAGLVGFAVVTIWVNGPLGFFMPATYEPILMVFGRVYPPVLIGFVGILGILYVEFLNFHLYRRVLQLQALSPARASRFVQLTVRLFERAPFFTVWLCAWSPLPYWAVRVVAPLAGYPIRRYLLATFLGRFPRLWFFAALGLYWHIGTRALSAIALGTIGVYAAIWLIRRSAGTGGDATAPSPDAG